MTPEEEAAVDEMQTIYSNEIMGLQKKIEFLEEQLSAVKTAKLLMDKLCLFEFRLKQTYKRQLDYYMKHGGRV